MANWYVDNSLGLDSNDGTAPGALSGGHGAWQTLQHAMSATLAAGDTVNIQANAGTYASWPTSSPDQTLSTYTQVSAGSAAAGFVSWVGRGGVPVIQVNGLTWWNASFQRFSGLYLYCASNGNNNLGVINGTGPVVLENCYINMNNQPFMIGVYLQGGEVRGCTIRGKSTAPGAASAGADLIYSASTAVVVVVGNTLYNGLADGINDNSSGVQARFNKIYGCAGNGVTVSGVSAAFASSVESNTIDNNLGHGVSVTATAGIATVAIRNNSITRHNGTGKYGVNVSDGSTATNDARKRYCNYNNLYNNTGQYNNISAGANDVNPPAGVDPSYTSPSTGDYTPTNAAMQAAFP